MTATFAYDIVDYPGHPRPQTHPDRLAAIARLHGIAAAAPGDCRYLEVGCGDAANLLPLALAYPRSHFVGIDLSAVAIARGERLRARLGLSNLSLQVADLTRWTPPRDAFDYVTAHGFYSWVPAPVRDALLALCRERLSPSGVAYVSYNALPGCHIRQMMWDMLRHHVDGIVEPARRIDAALEFLRLLDASLPETGAQAVLLREEARNLLARTDPEVLFHDDLAQINDPVSITTFAAHARQFDLQFLAEADYLEMAEEAVAEAAADRLRAMAVEDVVRKEQYLDFFKLRRFRQTLLCHVRAPWRRKPDVAVLPGFDVVGDVTADPAPADLTAGAIVQFRSRKGGVLSTDHPVAKAALVRIGEAFPASLPVAELATAARTQAPASGDDADADNAAVADTLLAAFRLGLVTCHCDAPRFATTAGERPQVSPLARAQLESGADMVTSLRPSVVRIENPLTRELLRLLDGTRDRAALLTALAARMASDTALIPPGEPARPATWWRDHLETQIDEGLAQVVRLALLVA